ncbi:hypothetical protein NPIL_76371 [Nephila pilipes]|uniref:Uncharacterized protein n=1 Tax=Nephila pilipes TaxID=299642 RepID=A0A8X6QKW4_NEPPI|nr:hypothetical protein NPIL_76371 [Nephila pilipes]
MVLYFRTIAVKTFKVKDSVSSFLPLQTAVAITMCRSVSIQKIMAIREWPCQIKDTYQQWRHKCPAAPSLLPKGFVQQPYSPGTLHRSIKGWSSLKPV